MAHLAAAALSALVEMEKLMAQEEEQDLLLFTKEEEEFMVVPTLEDSLIRLEDLMSEANFNVLTVDLLQNPSGVFVVDVERTSSNHNSNGDSTYLSNVQSQNFVQYNNNFGDHYQQQTQQPQQNYQYYQQQQPPVQQNQQFSYDSSDYKSFQNGMETGVQQQSAIYQSQPIGQRRFSELSDPTANWVAQSTDVAILERIVSESDRIQSVDDILDIVPQESSADLLYAQQNSPVLDKKQILEEIYREAEEISSRRDSPANFESDNSNSMWEYISNTSSSSPYVVDGDNSMDLPSVTQKKNFDHTFEKKQPKKEKEKKEKAPKREQAKAKKRHQNREAALRYRLKKRAERSATSEELGGLLERNEFLKDQKSSLASEIAYLKRFLSEVNRMKQVRS